MTKRPKASGRWRLLLLVSTCVVASAALAGSASATPSGNKVGVNVNFACPGSQSTALFNDIKAAAPAGNGWVRVPVSWRTLEPTTHGAFDLGYLQQIASCVAQAHNASQHVLLVMDYTPGWASSAAGNPYFPPSDLNYYGQAADELVYWLGQPAYGSQHVDAFEVWNEANTGTFSNNPNCGNGDAGGFWCGTVAQYCTMLQDAYTDIKSVSSSVTVVTAGTAHIDYPWTTSMLGCSGGKFDAIGIHPYPHDPTNTDAGKILSGTANQPNTIGTGGLLGWMNSHGYGTKPFWFTEFGWNRNTVDPGDTIQIQAAVQASALTNFYNYIRGTCSGCSNVKVAMWFTFQAPDQGWGLIDGYLNPWPAYNALLNLQ